MGHHLDPVIRVRFEQQTALENSVPEAYRSTIQNPNIDREEKIEFLSEGLAECILIAERHAMRRFRVQINGNVQVPERAVLKE